MGINWQFYQGKKIGSGDLVGVPGAEKVFLPQERAVFVEKTNGRPEVIVRDGVSDEFLQPLLEPAEFADQVDPGRFPCSISPGRTRSQWKGKCKFSAQMSERR